VSKLDQELIADCLAGHTHAFGDLVVRYQNRLFNTLVGVLGSVDDAHDVAQDAFVNAFQKLNTFRGHSAFYSWLFRIALNSAVSQKRKLNRIPVSIEAAREQTGVEPLDRHPAARPEYAMETTEKQVAVRAALAELAEEFRTALVLKEMEDLSYEEIAEIVGCPIGTVRSRIHRARAELRDKLQGWLQDSRDS
jgi:RNA polymerase sigma-70 factor (ECF subfamily)